MTTAQTGASDYDARMRRAARLSAEHLFATEFLDFYKHIAAFQKTLRANLAASSAMKSGGASVAGLRDLLTTPCFFPTSADFSP